jgi:hypothetical protein
VPEKRVKIQKKRAEGKTERKNSWTEESLKGKNLKTIGKKYFDMFFLAPGENGKAQHRDARLRLTDCVCLCVCCVLSERIRTSRGER